MKIAVTAQGDRLQSPVEERFGESSHILFYDTDGPVVDAVDNPAIETPNDGETLTAKLIVERGTQVLLTGTVKRDAGKILAAGGVDVWINTRGTVEDALRKFAAGELNLRPGPMTGLYTGPGSPATASPPEPEPGEGEGVGQARGVGAGPPAECVCPFCGETAPAQGLSCREMLCSNCAVPLVRDFRTLG